MNSIALRGLKIYFKDKAAVFFSLLGVIIIFCLFVFFLGDLMQFDFLDNVKEIMNSWMVAGMMASASITTCMGAYGIMVTDKEQKIIKDFYSSPIKRSSIVGGYMLTGFVISIIMSLITFAFGEIYIVASGGSLIAADQILGILSVVILSSFASSALICFIISFIKTSNAFTTLSVVIGTLIGFLVGAYINIGSLPDGVQTLIRYFPPAHAAALFRSILMQKPMAAGFENASDHLGGFKESLGVVFKYGDTVAEPYVHVLFLIGAGVLFYLLAIANIARKPNL